MPAPAEDPLVTPPLRSRVAASARAGGLAAGGSLAALAGAISLGAYDLSLVFEQDLKLDLGARPRHLGPWMAALFGWSAHRLPLVVWVGGTAVSFVLAVCFGYPKAARSGRDTLGRALGVAVFGLLVGAPLVLVAGAELPAPQLEGDVAVWALLAAGIFLPALVWMSWPARRIEDLEGVSAGGLLPPAPEPGASSTTFGLSASGPPLTAAETERAAPAVEVRVIWGGDLLRVVHLEPPRSFYVGEDADLAVDVEKLGAARFPLVLVRDGAVSVVAPRLATDVALAESGAHGAIARDDDVPGEPFDGGVPGKRIPLSPGARVTLALPATAAGTAYRAAGGEGSGGAPVVLEVALVRAGRVVGRGVSLRGHGPVMAGAAIAAAMASSWVVGGNPTLARAPDEDEAEAAFVRAGQEAFEAIRAREPEPEPEVRPPVREHMKWDGMIGLLSGPPDSGAEVCLAGLEPFPGMCASRYGAPFGVITRRGLGFSEVPTFPDLLWREPEPPRDPLYHWATIEPTVPPLWPSAAFGWAPPSTKVHFDTPTVSGHLSPAVVQRVLRGNFGRVRACFQEARREYPSLAGHLRLRFVVGADGALSWVYDAGSDLGLGSVIACVMRSFEGTPFPAPSRGVVTVVLSISASPYPFSSSRSGAP